MNTFVIDASIAVKLQGDYLGRVMSPHGRTNLSGHRHSPLQHRVHARFTTTITTDAAGITSSAVFNRAGLETQAP